MKTVMDLFQCLLFYTFGLSAMKKYYLILIIILIPGYVLISSDFANGIPANRGVNYDISDFFMDSKPIVSYDYLFGEQINSLSFFVNDRKQPCINYQYAYDEKGKLISKIIEHIYSGLEFKREYAYNDSGLITEITQRADNYIKKLHFFYNERLVISEVQEEVQSDIKDEYFSKFDFLRYRIDGNGNIVEVRGGNYSFLGLSTNTRIIKAYDYDEANRLKQIRDFLNPKGNQILSYDSK